MKVLHTFDHNLYHDCLKCQIHQNYNTNNQRGGGLGSVRGFMGRYIVPVIQKRVVPHIKTAAIGVAKDILKGENVKNSIKNNSISFMKNVRDDVTKSLLQQGNGIDRIKQTKRKVLHPVVVHPLKTLDRKILVPKKTTKQTKSSTTGKTKKKEILSLSKRDIFS